MESTQKQIKKNYFPKVLAIVAVCFSLLLFVEDIGLLGFVLGELIAVVCLVSIVKGWNNIRFVILAFLISLLPVIISILALSVSN